MEGRQLGRGRLQPEQGLLGAGLRVHEDAGDKVGEDPHPCTGPTSIPAAVTASESCSAVKRRGTGSLSPQRPAGSASARCASVKCPASALVRTALPRPAASRLRARGAGLAGEADAFGRAVDVLQHAVEEHDVEAVALDDVEQVVDVALTPRTRSATPASAARSLQREQRVRARVHHVTTCPRRATGTAKWPLPPPVSRTSSLSCRWP